MAENAQMSILRFYTGEENSYGKSEGGSIMGNYGLFRLINLKFKKTGLFSKNGLKFFKFRFFTPFWTFCNFYGEFCPNLIAECCSGPEKYPRTVFWAPRNILNFNQKIC